MLTSSKTQIKTVNQMLFPLPYNAEDRKYRLKKDFVSIYKTITKKRKLKNGKTVDAKYTFKSDNPDLNYLYGISPNDVKEVDYKIKKQHLFLNNTFLLFGEDKKIPLSKTVMTANITPAQYHAEVWNRIEALKKYSSDLNFKVPIFCTITPQTKYKPLKQKIKRNNIIHMVDNKNFSDSKDFVKNAMKDLSKRFGRFRRTRVMQDIKQEYGSRPVYMKTVEPTLDGVPHVHFIMYVPYSHLNRVVNAIKDILGKDSKVHYKTSFKDDAGGAVAYILKYILKSFKNQKTNKLNLIGYWFAKHQIRRFTTSRTLIPLQIFRKIRHDKDYQDYYKVTKLYEKQQIVTTYQNKISCEYEYIDEDKKEFRLSRSEYRQLVNNFRMQHGYIVTPEKPLNIP